MASRLALLLHVCEALCLFWVVEQPRGSLLFCHPRLQLVVRHFTVFKVCVHQFDFGAITEKATWLYSNRPWLGQMVRFALPNRAARRETLVTRAKRSDGVETYCANALTKGSQHCPVQFGIAFANVFKAHRHELLTAAMSYRESVDVSVAEVDDTMMLAMLHAPLASGQQGWLDADTLSVMQALRS